MSFRPQVARWFELLLPRESLPTALAVLSRTNAIELEARSEDLTTTAALPAEVERGLARWRELRRRFGAWWPADAAVATLADGLDPRQRLQRALDRLQRWAVEAEPRIATLEAIASERHQLTNLRRYLQLAGTNAPRPDWLATAGPRIRVALWRDRRPVAALRIPDSAVVQRIADPDGGSWILAVGAESAIADLLRGLPPNDTELVPLPRWLPNNSAAAMEAVDRHVHNLERQTGPLRTAIATLATTATLAQTLGDISFVEWYAANVPRLAVTGQLAWVTGWQRLRPAASIEAALTQAKIAHLVRYPTPPPGFEPPVTLENPRWAAPFEMFVRLIGTPARMEADPSLIVAIVAPLLFGFMFADFGQGAVLLASGLLLRRRFPGLALLVPGGLASMLFGLLFGCMFAREDLLTAWWLRPFEAPLAVLGAALGLGVLVIVVGLTIDAANHVGAGRVRDWMRHRAGIALIYLGAVLAIWRPPIGLATACAGLLFGLLASSRLAPPAARWSALGAAAGELVESSLQLAVNTVSFVRVGAFALAHSGLAAAVAELAAATGSRLGALSVFVVGNAFMLVLEAVVVGIQTTRLVLFEFFVRFLEGSGRSFKPLPAAPLSPSSVPGGSA